jgi:ketosteroid isomerase-like protein
MSTTAVPSTFDLDALRTAMEQRDAEGQIALYADDATITAIDHTTPPSSPAVLTGRDAIAAHLRGVCERDMTHRVGEAFVAGDRLVVQLDCAYPDGTRVRCLSLARLRDGRIAEQEIVQAWDH